jgi:hypothetical protein
MNCLTDLRRSGGSRLYQAAAAQSATSKTTAATAACKNAPLNPAIPKTRNHTVSSNPKATFGCCPEGRQPDVATSSHDTLANVSGSAWCAAFRSSNWRLDPPSLSFGDVKVRSARSCTPRRASRSVKFAPRRCGATRATQRRRAPTSVSAGDPAKSSSTGRHPWPSPMRSSNGSHRSWRPRTAGRSTVRRQTSVPPPTGLVVPAPRCRVGGRGPRAARVCARAPCSAIGLYNFTQCDGFDHAELRRPDPTRRSGNTRARTHVRIRCAGPDLGRWTEGLT